jgi:cytochrome c556
MEEAMKKLVLLALFSDLGTLAFAADLLPYDSAAVKDIMHSNQATVGVVSKGITAGDWKAVADGFTQFAQNAKKALTYAPPKGDVAEWQKIWNDFLSAANQGVAAAGAKDAVAAKKFLDQITGDRNQGHPKFRG